MSTRLFTALVYLGWVVGSSAQQAPVEKPGGHIDLPSSKQIVGVIPGNPQRLNSLPVSMAVSPNGRWVVTVNAGYGSFESKYMQSLSVMDTTTGKIEEFPDPRTGTRSKQVLYSGLTFSSDGKSLYSSIVSASDPEGRQEGDTGSGVQCYLFTPEGKIVRQGVLKLPPPKLAAGRTTKLMKGGDGSLALPYPGAIVEVPGLGRRLLIAGSRSDDVVLMDYVAGRVIKRFDLAESDAVPSVYPVALALSKSGSKAYVALSNASEVVELDLLKGTVGRKLQLLKPDSPVATGSRPAALAMAPDGNTMYVALGNRDAVAAVDLTGAGFKLKGYFDTRLPGQTCFGALPEALAVNADGSRLYVANLGSDAVAVIDTHKLTRAAVARGMVEPDGFIPTEWMPTGVAVAGGKLYIASGKGTGTGPNNFPQRPTPDTRDNKAFLKPYSYIPSLLHGSLAVVDEKTAIRDLKALTVEVLIDNRMKAADERIAWDAAVLARTGTNASPQQGGQWTGPIRHVVYLIKENRTYDQVFGDLPVGNGDKSLTMYGAEVTPNQHKLAMQFGVLDNFYDSGEVSGDGHVWSNAAINSVYNERTWQVNYRGREQGYDYEGVVANGVPLEQNIPDVAEPGTGYLWGNADRHGRTHYNFGEYIASMFCTDKKNGDAVLDPQEGPVLPGSPCAGGNEVKPGQRLPAAWGGQLNRWPWAIPLLAANHPTKPELLGHYAEEAPDFNIRIPDQLRANVFERHFDDWVKARAAGSDTMPNLITMRLGNDHTGGTTAGGPTPKASIADNDLAVGRIVDLISHSAYWDDTAIFVVEDDGQNGADHVDAHRSLALVVSKYAPHPGAGAGAVVDSTFYSTVSLLRTIETVLGLPPMNNNDAFSSLIGSAFTGTGDQPPFTTDRANDANDLIYTANKSTAPGAKTSARMDFRHEDRADAQKLNLILWQDAMGAQQAPAMLTQKHKKNKKDDDD